MHLLGDGHLGPFAHADLQHARFALRNLKLAVADLLAVDANAALINVAVGLCRRRRKAGLLDENADADAALCRLRPGGTGC